MTEDITIPGYKVIRQLGQGGTATVYLAIQNSFGREIALKVMSPLLNQDPTFAPRFAREARIVSQMHHASIVPVFDVGEHRRHHYLSMELLPGGDLRQRIVDGHCGPTAALGVMQAISSALEFAHRKGFVHRDIKPQNILFREDGTPVLTDFGIARAIDVGTSLTAAGMFVGTPNYMSPEQVKGLELDGRSDLYSLGIVFYEMLTGSVPFQADSALSIALKHLSDPLPPLPPQLSMYQPFIDRLTAKDKDQRFANSTEVIRALSTLTDSPHSTLVRQPSGRADGSSRSNVGDRVLHAKAPRTARPWIPWTAAALVVVAIAAGTALMLPNRIADPQAVPPAANTTSMAANTSTPAASSPPIEPETPAPDPAAAPADTPVASAPAMSTPPADTPPVNAAPAKTPIRPAVAVESAQTREKKLAAERRVLEAAAAARRRQQIVALLADAQSSFDSGDLVHPSGDSAADHYRAILELQPQQPEAVAGLSRVTEALIAQAESARKANEVDQALQLLSDARSIRPDHPRIAKLQADLEERKVKLQLRAESNLKAAAEQLSKARVYLDRTPVALRNIAEANDHYDKASEIAATAPDLSGVRERILAGYADAAQMELTAKEPARALKVLHYARKRNMSSTQLDELEMQIQQQLAKR